MSRRDDDHIGHVPKMTPAHDEIASFKRTKAKGSFAASLGDVPDVQGNSSVMKPVVTAMVLVLIVALGLSGYLYQRVTEAENMMKLYEARIGSLEQRLSVTDESMSESSVAMKVKVKEMDSEIRKLWDNVWKKSKESFAKIDVTLNNHQKSIATNEAYISSAKQLQSQNDQVVNDLKQQLAGVKQTQSTVTANQKLLASQERSIETTNDKINRTTNSIAVLDNRVKETEEWVESINGFRRQVNRDVSELNQKLGQMQGAL